MEQVIENPTTVDYATVAAATAAVFGTEPVRAQIDSVQIIEATKQRVQQLAIEREVWQEGEYARSNEILYGLIGKCKALYDDLTAKADVTKHKRTGFDDYLNTKGYAFKSSTELTYKVVRAVFGDKDRRRLSTYHTVLRVAVKQGWKADEFAARIADYGGVQEISLGAASGQMTAKQKAETVKSAVMDETVAVLKSDTLSKAFGAKPIGEKAVAVLTQEADGSFSVHAVVHNNSAVTAALAAYYAANKAALKDAAKKQAVVDAQTQRADAIDTAAKSVANG